MIDWPFHRLNKPTYAGPRYLYNDTNYQTAHLLLLSPVHSTVLSGESSRTYIYWNSVFAPRPGEGGFDVQVGTYEYSSNVEWLEDWDE